MRTLLDSSWMRFGPAGREYEWPTGAPITQHKQEDTWTELDLSLERRSDQLVLVLLPVCSVLILVVLVGFLVRRCSRSKLSLDHVIALDLGELEEEPGADLLTCLRRTTERHSSSGADLLSSLRRTSERHSSTSSDGSDGVFVMVYLPPPYEQTLTRITRASLSSNPESLKTEDLEARLCPV